MERRKQMSHGMAKVAVVAGLGMVTATMSLIETHVAAVGSLRFTGPTQSQPLALDADSTVLAVVNPDNDSVSFFDLRQDKNRRLAVVGVQDEPNGVALMPDGRRAYVANTVSGTVSVIDLNIANGVISKPAQHIPVGVEPYGMALTPSGTKLYVSNARSNTISVIDTASNTVIKTIEGVGLEPRGLAVSNDGDDVDTDETLYVTQFLSVPIAGKIDGQDDAKKGVLTVIETNTDSVTGTIDLNPIADTGFKAAGDAIARVPPGTEFTFTTGAYPNQLNNVALWGRFAFVPNTGASPNGPVRFNVNTQSLLSVADVLAKVDAGQTINMHRAVGAQTGSPKLFITQPWAMAFEHNAPNGFVLSASSNHVVKVVVNPMTGAPVVQNDPNDPTRVLQIPTGKNPRGIVVNHLDTRAYVMNYVSRDVTVMDLTPLKETVLTTMRSADLPAFGSEEDKIHAGKELYNTSVGEFDPPNPFSLPIRGRMSDNGWGSCASCHPNGLTDNVVWIFPAGPRRTIPQHADFDPADRNQMRVLNWSANRDEQEDFELNIRGVSGGLGLIVLADGVTPDPDVADFTPRANGGRNQLKIRSHGAWDALKAYVQFGIRAPISPVSASDPDVIAGRELFISASCQTCHGGASWTSSRVRYNPPPAGSQVAAGQLVEELRKVGTFNAALLNEVRQNAAAPLGGDGFVPPSLMSMFAFQQAFPHGGEFDSLEGFMNNVEHRAAGTGGVDTLSNPADRQKLIKFMLSIDANTPPVPIP